MVKVGDKIRLVEMDDPHGVPPGTEGVVTNVNLVDLGRGDKFGQISVDWDNGSSLMLCVPPDRYEVVSSDA